MIKLSVIIPALNEQDYILKTITALKTNRFYDKSPEIIVIDTGSTDDTVIIAEPVADKLIRYKPCRSGRTEALNAGAESSSGDVLLFLDADTIVPLHYDKEIETALEDEGVTGGAFEFALGGTQFGLRIVEFINRIRYRIRGSFYGDQGLFVKREMFFKAGMYPDRRLFETSEFCKKLRRYGKLRLIRKKAVTSPRRFIAGGINRVLLNDTKLWFLNNLGLNVAHYMADNYWDNQKYKVEYTNR